MKDRHQTSDHIPYTPLLFHAQYHLSHSYKVGFYFFRNSINNGLLLIEQPDLHDDIKEGDTITVKMNEHVDYNGKTYPIAALPENLMDIIQAGGLVKAMRKRNGLD